MRLVGLLLMALPAPALASPFDMPEPMAATLDCAFSVECIETEPCAETSYAATIIVPAREGGSVFAPNAFLEDEAGRTPLSLGTLDPEAWTQSVAWFNGMDLQARQMITRAGDGATWMTIHLNEGPMMINYRGQCEVSN